jgi:hypothetical protein
MTCRETVRLICEYLEGRLSPLVEKSVQRHLGQCQNCHLVLETAEKTLAVYFDGEGHFAPHRKARVA